MSRSMGPCLCGDPYCPACGGRRFDEEECPICGLSTEEGEGEHSDCLAIIKKREQEAEEAICKLMHADDDLDESIFEEGMCQSEQSQVENGF